MCRSIRGNKGEKNEEVLTDPQGGKGRTTLATPRRETPFIPFLSLFYDKKIARKRNCEGQFGDYTVVAIISLDERRRSLFRSFILSIQTKTYRKK